jgi:hypothetical protein
MAAGLLYDIRINDKSVGQVYEQLGGPFSAEGPGVRGILVTEQESDHVYRTVPFATEKQFVDCAETIRPADEKSMNVGHVCYCVLEEDHWQSDDPAKWKHFCATCKKLW